MPKFIEKLPKYFILLAVSVMGISNLLFLNSYNLHPDEAYYWVWSRQLDIGYFDNSPLVAYVIRLFTSIGGNNEFWVRFPAFLGWLSFLIFIYYFIKEIYQNQRSAWFGVFIGAFVPLVASGSHIMTHDIPMIFFSCFTWYFLYLAIEKEQKTAWYWVGLLFGLALFSKFQAVLIGLAVFIMLLVRPTKRKILITKEPYIAVSIGFLMFLPVLYWNWTHHWAAFLWQFQHGVHRQINLNNELTYIAGQMGVFSPLLFISLIYYTIKKLIQWRNSTSGTTFLIGCYLPVFLFFGATSLTFPAAPNWPAVGYLPAIVFLSGEYANSLKVLSNLKRGFLKIYLGLAIILSIVLLSLIRYPEVYINKFNLNMSPDIVLTNGIYGWDSLGKKVDEILVRDFQPSPRPKPILGDSYQTAAELQFYVSKPVVVFVTRQAHRNHYDFITENKIFQFDGQPGLLVLETELPKNALWYFKEIKLVDTLTLSRFNHRIRKFYIYRFQSLNGKSLYDMAVNKPYGYPGDYPN